MSDSVYRIIGWTEIDGLVAFLSQNENGGSIDREPGHSSLRAAGSADVGMALLAWAIIARGIREKGEGDRDETAG